MKTTKILTAVSAAALLGISSVALAQGTGSSGGGSGSSGAPAGNTMQRQQDAPPAASGSSSTQGSSGSMSKDSMSKDSTSGDRMTQGMDGKDGKDGQKAAQQDRMGKDSQKSTTQSQGGQMGKDKDTQKSQAQDRTPGATDSKSKMSKDSAKEGAKSDTTVGAAPAGAVNLTTEQRTTIRQTVLTSNAPRATNINFSVNVGTVVPSSVRVVAVPDTIIRINPRWKGYRYFVYNDEIIIVEPRTLKIVAVLDV
jgi:hypothetical protein